MAPEHPCQHNPCASVSEFVGQTRADITHLKKDLEDIKLETRECLQDMRSSAEVVKTIEISLSAIQTMTDAQNNRLRQGDERFLSHERRMGEIEKAHKQMRDTLECLPDKMSGAMKDAFDRHHDSAHTPLKKRVKYLIWGMLALLLFILSTEHGTELVEFVRSMGLFPRAGGA